MFEIANYVQSVTENGETMLLDTRVEQFLALNATGAFIWERLQRGDSIASIVEALVKTTGADAVEVERDTREFIEGLLSRGFVCEKASRAA